MNVQLIKNSSNPPSSEHPSHSHQSPCLEGALQACGPLSSPRPLLGYSPIPPPLSFPPSYSLNHTQGRGSGSALAIPIHMCTSSSGVTGRGRARVQIPVWVGEDWERPGPGRSPFTRASTLVSACTRRADQQQRLGGSPPQQTEHNLHAAGGSCRI